MLFPATLPRLNDVVSKKYENQKYMEKFFFAG